MTHSNRTHARPSAWLRAPCQVAIAIMIAVACSRSALEPGDLEPTNPGAEGGRDGAAPPVTAGTSSPPLFPDAGLDASADAAAPNDAAPPDTPIVSDAGPACSAADEICNGLDDDCDGRVDDIAPVACDSGGFRYCVGGRQSACPDRCEACIPGSERICFISYCTFWGVQTCAADGRGFGVCREEHAPSECRRYADNRRNLDRLEQCCIDAGYCCVDAEDLDGDGNRAEMLGRCADVVCR